MFGELLAQLRNEVKFDENPELCSAKQMFAQLRTGLTDKVHLSVKGLSLLLRDVQAFLSPSCTGSDRPIYASAVKSGQHVQRREQQTGEQKRHQQVQRQGQLFQQPQQSASSTT